MRILKELHFRTSFEVFRDLSSRLCPFDRILLDPRCDREVAAGSAGYSCTRAAADSKPDVFWARPAVKIGCIAPAASLFLPFTSTSQTNETDASLVTFTIELHSLDTSGKLRGCKVD